VETQRFLLELYSNSKFKLIKIKKPVNTMGFLLSAI
jgi:hypothetical protein